MTRTHRPAALLLTLGFALAGLTACAEEEPVPKFAEEPTAAPTPVEKEETAKEFIRRWARIEREMQNTGDTTEYRAITEQCDVCQKLADDMDEVYSNGGWVRTDGMTISRITTVSENTYRTKAKLAPTEFALAEGQAPGQFAGGQRTYLITLEKIPAGWRVVALLKDGSE